MAEKARDLRDERVVRLTRTDAGTEVLQEQTSLDVERMSTCLSRLSTRERSAVRRGFAILLKGLKDDEGG